jgi:hypothetical protein
VGTGECGTNVGVGGFAATAEFKLVELGVFVGAMEIISLINWFT